MGGRFRQLSKTALQEISEVFLRISDDDVRVFLEKMKSSKRIFLLAAGREGLATRAFAMRLMHLGKTVYWIWDDTTPAIEPEDLLICACGSADVGHEKYIADMAKKGGAELLLITASDRGKMLELADIRVKIPAAAYKAQGDFVESEQLMGNLFEQTLFVFYDVLIMMLREEMGISKKEMTERHRNVE